MDGIEKSRPISKTDTRNKYLKTLRYTPNASVIDAVEPIRPAANQLGNQKPSFMFNVDTLNRHLDDLQNAYKNLTEQQRKYKDSLQHYLQDPEHFLGLVKELVKHFNQTTACVLTFDRAFHTRHSEILGDLLARQQFNLEQIGLRIVGINQLEFDAIVFKRGARENPHFFDTQLPPAIALFNQAFNFVNQIRIPSDHEHTNESHVASMNLSTSHIFRKG